MRELTVEIKNEIKELVYDYLAEECEVDKSEITDETNVINDLEGDSLMFVEVVESLKKKYGLTIEMQTIGKYLLKNPAKNVKEVVEICWLVYEKENDIVEG